MAPAALQKALDAGADIPALRTVLVARHGLLVAEHYYAGAQASDLVPINSITKVVGSMLVGQALQQGKIQDLSQTVGQLLPDVAARYPASLALPVTLGQILTGTSGLAYSLAQVRDLVRAPDPVAYVMALPGDGKPAGSWSYNDAAVSLLTPILERAQGMTVEDLVRRDLFTPLGIREFAGRRDASGRAMAYMGLRMHPRDVLKLATMVCQDGTWNQTRVLAQAWVADSTRSHVVPDWRIRSITDTGFGYLWFTGTIGGQRVAWAWGYGGQFALIVPALDLAVVTFATDPVPAQLGAQTNAVMAVIAWVIAAI